MDFLTRREVSGIKQDVRNGVAKQTAEKTIFEKKLLDGLGSEMEDALEHPEKSKKDIRFAKKANRKKRLTVWKENLRKILGMEKKKETI